MKGQVRERLPCLVQKQEHRDRFYILANNPRLLIQ